MFKIGFTRLSRMRLAQIQQFKLYQLVLASLFFCSLTAQAHSTQEDPQVAWNKIDAGAIVIDVRTAGEFAQDHLNNAINIPFELIIKGVNKYQIDKTTPIVVYCRSGRRSGIAYDTLIKAGYLKSYNGGGLVNLQQHRASNPPK